MAVTCVPYKAKRLLNTYKHIDGGWFWNNFTELDESLLVTFPGELTGFEMRGGKKAGFYVDYQTGKVYDDTGQVAFGSVEEAKQKIGELTERQLKDL